MVFFLATIEFRIQGLPEDIMKAKNILKESFIIHSESDFYSNRNSNYVRVYIDAECKEDKNE